jgi:hypothetical protein
MVVSQVKNGEEHETHALTAKNSKPYFKKNSNLRLKEREIEEESALITKK